MENDSVMVWLIEDLAPLRFRRKENSEALIAEDVLRGSTEHIGVYEAEFDTIDSELIVEFSLDSRRLERIALPLRRKV